MNHQMRVDKKSKHPSEARTQEDNTSNKMEKTMNCIAAASKEEKVKSSSNTEKKTQEKTTRSPKKKDTTADGDTDQQQDAAKRAAAAKAYSRIKRRQSLKRSYSRLCKKKHAVNEFE